MKQTIPVTMILLMSMSTLFAGWQMVWQDEFDYTGLPDASKWSYETGNGGWGNNEIQNYVANRTENSRVENGTLVIEARRDWFNGPEYSSVRLVTTNKGDWKYGRIEVKAKIPLGGGMWPAIWMLPTDWVYGNKGWPDCGEIDIMENWFNFEEIRPYSIDGNIHTNAYNHTIGTNKGARINNLSNIEDTWHVYAVEWYADRLLFMVDDVVYFTFNNEGTWQTWPYDQRFHLILNIAVGGTLGGAVDPNIFPKRMTVDYVRVYQEDEGPIGPDPTTGLITLYNDDQYKGFSVGLSEGDYTQADLEALGYTDNSLTSLAFPKGYQVELYEHNNYGGEKVVFTSSNGNVGGFNDKMSSCKIRAKGVSGVPDTVTIINKNSGLALDLENNGAPADGANYLQWSPTGGDNQQFIFEEISNGVYGILNKKTGKPLDVNTISMDDGANIQQYGTDYTGGHRQFIVIESSPGYYQLVARHSGKVVEVDGASTDNGANVQQWQNDGQACSEWELKPVEIIVPVTTSIIKSTSVVTAFQAGNNLQIRGLSKSGADYVIRNIHGRTLAKGTLSQASPRVNTENLSPGMYMLSLTGVHLNQSIRFRK